MQYLNPSIIYTVPMPVFITIYTPYYLSSVKRFFPSLELGLQIVTRIVV